MQLTLVCSGSGVITVDVAGEIDLALSGAFRDQLFDVVDLHGPDVVLNLSSVEFLDASALSALLTVRERCRQRGGSLRLISVPHNLYRMMRACDFPELLDVVEAVEPDAARAHLSRATG